MNQRLRISTGELQEMLAGPEVDGDELSEQFALVAWSVICEPGDALAGLLVRWLGATKALECLIENTSAGAMQQLLLDSGCEFNELSHWGNFANTYSESRQRWMPRLQLAKVKKAIEQIGVVGGSVITRRHEHWPVQLCDLAMSEPFALWVRGSTKQLLNTQHSAAIVGSRGASSYGEYVTGDLVRELVANRFAVISGGAYGIDAVAHREALGYNGSTIAVMAGGLDAFYPRGNHALLSRIAEQCAVIAEVPPGMAPTKWRFLQRNRLIAALAQSVTVVEANWRSGAINTVSHAEALEREIFAVPGPVTSPKSAGTNRLIADLRAKLIVDAKDLMHQLSGRMLTQPTLSGLGSLEIRALDAIGFGSLELAEVCSAAGLTRDEARIALGSLELDGLVVRRSNAWVKQQTTV
jgi:DNA processing protein